VHARISRIAVAVALAIVAIALGRFVRDHWGGVYDDAFIYLRYVKNLGAGCGLRFNCGDPPVEGFTGPLYLALLWLGAQFTPQLIDLCQIVCTLSLAVALGLAVATAVVLGRGERADAAPDTWRPAGFAVAIAVVLALDHFVLLNAITGMETALGAAALTALALAALTDRPRLVIAALAAALLVRPESLVFVAALPILPALRRPRFLIAIAAVIAAICIARFAVFGALLPNTYYAKSGGTARHAALGLAYLANAARDFPLAVLAPLALLLPAGRLRRGAAFVLAGAAVWLAFFLRTGGDLFEYSRLAFPLVPALDALALAGVAAMVDRIAHRPQLATLAAAACALATAGRAAIAHDLPPQGTSPRVVEWAAIGSYLRDHFRGRTVATVPIGAIGYYSRLPILDLVGLTEPAIARAGRSVPPELLTKLWIGHERNCTECVLARAPDVIVTTMHRAQPWQRLDEARAGFYADWLLLQEIKAGRAPYQVRDAEVTPGDHVLLFERTR
jgi:arabinofuranosyltransferase